LDAAIPRGLRTCIYPVEDLAAAKAWYAQAFNATPNFDEPFYVGFTVGGFERRHQRLRAALPVRQPHRADLQSALRCGDGAMMARRPSDPSAQAQDGA
jgi:hypothetical protein